MNKKLFSVVTASLIFLGMASPAFAHVVVKPASVGVAAFQTFDMGVPNEKDTPTTAVKLMIPAGLKEVSPNVKPGWLIEVKKAGTGDDAAVTEIDWTGGSIPVGQRDDFLFSAQVPASETTLQWKAYQTYQSGEVVSWDQDPNAPKPSGSGMDAEGTPYSTTKVVNDLVMASPSSNGMVSPAPTSRSDKTALMFSVVALALSAVALGYQFRKR